MHPVQRKLIYFNPLEYETQMMYTTGKLTLIGYVL